MSSVRRPAKCEEHSPLSPLSRRLDELGLHDPSGARSTGDWRSNPEAEKALNESATRPTDPDQSVLLVCGVRLRRESLDALLRAKLPGVQIVSVADPRPVEAWRGASPLVALIDAPTCDRPLLDAIADIVAAAPNVRPMILSDDASRIDPASQAKMAVAGTFPVSAGAPLLIAAIELVLAGGRFELESPPRARRSGDAAPAASDRRGEGATDQQGAVGPLPTLGAAS